MALSKGSYGQHQHDSSSPSFHSKSSHPTHHHDRSRQGRQVEDGGQVQVPQLPGGTPVPGRPDAPPPAQRQLRLAHRCRRARVPPVRRHPFELAGNASRDYKKTRINPRHVQLAVRNDDELNKTLMVGVLVCEISVHFQSLHLLVFGTSTKGSFVGEYSLPVFNNGPWLVLGPTRAPASQVSILAEVFVPILAELVL